MKTEKNKTAAMITASKNAFVVQLDHISAIIT